MLLSGRRVTLDLFQSYHREIVIFFSSDATMPPLEKCTLAPEASHAAWKHEFGRYSRSYNWGCVSIECYIFIKYASNDPS